MEKYEEWLTGEGLILLRGWVRDDLTEEEIAQRMGISTRTLTAWKKKSPELARILRYGKALTEYQVEEALIRNALGHRVTETVRKTDSSGNEEITEKVREEGGRASAQIFWLKNRGSGQWSDRPAPNAAAAEEPLEGIRSFLEQYVGKPADSGEADETEG